MASPRSAVEALLNSRTEAVWHKDIERLMSLYSSDIVYFDLVPGLQYTGVTALRARFLEWFAAFDGPITMGARDLHIQEHGDLAIAFMLNRTSGRLKNGRDVGYWVRATVCWQRSDRGWSIVHEHISVPVDMATRAGAFDLMP